MILSFHYSFTAPPSRPVEPLKVYDIERTSATIEWSPPEDDGGVPLTGYIIERRDAGRSFWAKVEKIGPSKTFLNITKLMEGVDQHFRVMAENKIGVSPSLETEKPALIKSPFGIYFFNNGRINLFLRSH